MKKTVTILFLCLVAFGTQAQHFRPDAFPPQEEPLTPKSLTMATTLDEMYQWNRYPTYGVYLEMMNHFVETYPDLCHLDTIGTSVNGRLILSLVIVGTATTDIVRPNFFYSSTIHGDPGFGIYEKPYNNSITGEKWDYPEFKGYYAEFHAVTLHNSQQPDLTLFVPDEDRFVQLYAPQRPAQYVAPSVPVVPQEDICVLSHISPIGSKFTLPHVEGPQGEKNHCKGQTIRGSVYLRFGE